MRKRVMALLCAAALLCALALPVRGTSDAVTVYLLAANDKFCDLPGGALPVAVNGVIYIPYTTFDRNATGVDLGVYYGIDQTQGTVLTLYSLNGRLSFSMGDGTCEDGLGNPMGFRAVSRNGILYVPASAVCGFFGLQYSMLPTADRGTLIRVSSGRAHLSDSDFLANSTGTMTYRYNQIMQSIGPVETPRPVVTPAPQSPVVSSPPNASKEKVRVYLAVDASGASGDITSVFPADAYAVFFFAPDTLAANAAAVRRAVAAGHSIGLTVRGGIEEAREQLSRGNELLTHIARTRTRVVSAPAALTGQLTGEGWVCWSANTTGESAGAILSALDAKRTVGYVALPGRSTVINRVISEIRRDGYDLRRPIETEI